MSSYNIEQLIEEAKAAIHHSRTLANLEELRIHYLGKKGLIATYMQQLRDLAAEERKALGQQVNHAKQSITDALAERKHHLEEEVIQERLSSEYIDITAPIRSEQLGYIHPITQTIEELVAILSNMGFTVAEGPDIEDDWHNFTALNVPMDHPARQMQDTFYLKDHAHFVLRTQTSSVQIRVMEQGKPPFRIVAPGRVFRSDYDATHTPMFHQIEGLYIDQNIHMGHLKGCLATLLERFFNLDHVPMRFRPSFFPFTEPSAEVDIGCRRDKQQIVLGEGDEWLEILGCGMVHPKVLENVGVDPEIYQGFAFGLGVERLAMLKYGIPDLRTFFEGDIRWLRHFGFHGLDIPTGKKG